MTYKTFIPSIFLVSTIFSVLILVVISMPNALAEDEITVGPKQEISVDIAGAVATQGPESTFVYYYNLMLGLVGISAFFMITWGGFQYATSLGNPAAISAGKDKIWGALIGILLAATSFLILKTINPDLTVFKLTTQAACPIPVGAEQAVFCAKAENTKICADATKLRECSVTVIPTQ